MKNVELVVGPSWVYVYGDQGFQRLLDQALRVKNPQAFWANKDKHPKAPRMDEWHRLYDKGVNRFAKGVLGIAVEALQKAGWKCNITQTGLYIPPPDPIFWPASFTPWDHQREAVEQFWAKEFGVMEIPTRGGKAKIGMLAATRYTNKHPVAYFVTKLESKEEIMAEWATDFKQGPVFGDAGDENGLHVMTYMAGMNRDLSPYKFVVADEVHLTGAEGVHDCLMRCDQAWFRLGMTGTSEGRTDNKDIYITAAVGPPCYSMPRQTLVDQGLCATATIYMVQVPGSIEIEGRPNWRKIEEKGLLDYEPRTNAMIEAALSKWDDGQLLVLVQRMAHGERFARALTQKLGYEVGFVNGSTKKKERKKIYEDYKTGKLKVLVASSIFNDSVTFPDVKVLIMAPAGKSSIATRQRLGRALTGEKDVVIIDSYDAHHRVLERHSKARMKAYGKEGYKVERLYRA
jgi:superfamily II DNA or RNA helicase